VGSHHLARRHGHHRRVVFFFIILAVRLARMDSFNTFTSAAYIILMFLTLAWLNPMTWQVDVLRFTLLGVGPVTTVLMESRDFLHSR
jgi:hypothetical protein